MKKIILIFVVILFTFSVNAQKTAEKFYEGNAQVTFQNGTYATIVFGRNGHPPTTFIVKDEKLIEGKYYQFFIKAVKLKGTKETAKILYRHVAEKQKIKDRKEFLETMSNQKFIWL